MLLKIVFILITLVFFINPAYCWYIKDYDIDINILNNGVIDITERIIVDFEHEQKHGIFRTIPLRFTAPNGVKKYIEISDIKVVDLNNREYPIKISYENQNIKIRIGDPNIKVSGTQSYVIYYRVNYVLYSINNIDELYWNAIGTEWDTSIKRSTVKVTLPFDNPNILFTCYTGLYGSKEKNCSVNKQNNVIYFKLLKPLKPSDGFTIAVGWPTGLIQFEKEKPFFKNQWFHVIVLQILLLTFLFSKWYYFGRDVGGKGVIQVQYFPPKDLTPIEAGTIMDEKLQAKDILAEIIDLARRGFIKIEESTEKILFFKKKDYIFIRQKPEQEHTLNIIDREILNAIFENSIVVSLSTVKKDFSKSMKTLSKLIYSDLTDKGYFVNNPLTIKNIYLLIGTIITFGSMYAGKFISPAVIDKYLLYLMAGVVFGIEISIAGFFMPRKTKKGTKMKEYMLGYKEFVSRVEANVIKKLFPPEKRMEVFEKTLPYAICFGVAKQWTSAFSPLFAQPPDWYIGSHNSFSTFSNDINDFTDTFTNSISGGSGSGGGGFSGGGAGGGGGGSW